MNVPVKLGPLTVDGTTTTAVFPIGLPSGLVGAELVFGDVTGLQGTLQGSLDGSAFFEIDSAMNAGGTITRHAAGDAITAVDYARVGFDVPGLTHVRFTRTGGSGPLHVVCYQDALTLLTALIRQIAVGGLSSDTEMGAAAAAADNTGNPTAGSVRGFPHLWDGLGWDRWPGDSGNGGDVDVTRIAAGSNLIGDVALQGRASGGLSFYKTLDLDETEEEVKAAAGQLYGFLFFNASASTRYLKVYNATAANVVVGTTVPDLTIPLPAGLPTGLVLTIGVQFTTAITIAATTGIADNDSGAPGANDVSGFVLYK